MKFIFSHKYDFEPDFQLSENRLECVKQMKIFGIQVSESLKWDKHVKYICLKARKRIWILRRMMQINMNYENILDFYYKEIRSILEYGVVVFNGALTKKLSKTFEDIQRNVLSLLCKYLGLKMSYSEATIFFFTEPLNLRREDICKTFIKRNMKNPKYKEMFKKNDHCHNVRAKTSKFKEYKARTKRFQSSPLVYLTKLANQL